MTITVCGMAQDRHRQDYDALLDQQAVDIANGLTPQTIEVGTVSTCDLCAVAAMADDA